MAEEPTTPDLVEMTRRGFEAWTRRGFDAAMTACAPDAVWEASIAGIGRFEGATAIRRHLEDWIGVYDEHDSDVEEINGLTVSYEIDRARAGAERLAEERG